MLLRVIQAAEVSPVRLAGKVCFVFVEICKPHVAKSAPHLASIGTPLLSPHVVPMHVATDVFIPLVLAVQPDLARSAIYVAQHLASGGTLSLAPQVLLMFFARDVIIPLLLIPHPHLASSAIDR